MVYVPVPLNRVRKIHQLEWSLVISLVPGSFHVFPQICRHFSVADTIQADGRLLWIWNFLDLNLEGWNLPKPIMIGNLDLRWSCATSVQVHEIWSIYIYKYIVWLSYTYLMCSPTSFSFILPDRFTYHQHEGWCNMWSRCGLRHWVFWTWLAVPAT